MLFGLDFEDVRDPFVSICETVANAIGYRGDIFCAPTIDNFGPHVSEMFFNHSIFNVFVEVIE